MSINEVYARSVGYIDSTKVKNVTTSDTAAEVECTGGAYYLVIASQDCFFKLKGSTGDGAGTSDMFLPAGVPLMIRMGRDKNYFSAIQSGLAGFVRLAELKAGE